MIFTKQKNIFENLTSILVCSKKKFGKIMKNIGDMAKRTFIQKMQKKLNFYYM